MTEIPAVSFGGGILSPALFARIDLPKFSSGLSDAKNFFVHAEGGISKRPGTQFVNSIPYATTRLISFKFNEEQSYALEFTGNTIRVYRNGGLLLRTIGEVTPGTGSDTVVVTNLLKLKDEDLTDIRQIYLSGATNPVNNGYYSVSAARIQGANALITIEFPDGVTYTDFIGATISLPVQVSTPYLSDELFDIGYTQSNDILYLTHINHPPMKLLRLTADDWDLRPINFNIKQSPPAELTSRIIASEGKTTNIKFEIKKYTVTAISGSTGEESIASISSDILNGGTSVYTIGGITALDDGIIPDQPGIPGIPGGGNFEPGDNAGVVIGISGSSNKHKIGRGGEVDINGKRYVVRQATEAEFTNNLEGYHFIVIGLLFTDLDFAVGDKMIPCYTFLFDNKNPRSDVEINFAPVPGASHYNIYKEDKGIFGFIGETTSANFTDDGIQPDLLSSPPTEGLPFEGENNNPSVVALHEQRTVWCNSERSPLGLWMSQTAQFENLSTSAPTRVTDAITLKIVTGRGNEIRHLRSFSDRLLIFTSGSVWSIRPGDNSSSITPTSKLLSVENYLPCTSVEPLTIKDSVLMVSGASKKGFEVHLISQSDSDSFSGSDMTVLARHLFENNTIVDWAYAHSPNRLVGAVRDDGKVLILSLLSEHKVFAWTMWEIEGKAESICSVQEGAYDVFYVVVNRDGDRSIEKISFHENKDNFLDSSLSISFDEPTDTIYGLRHLEGEEVTVVIDGGIETATVRNGSITASTPGTRFIIGRDYEAYITSLPLNLGARSTSKTKIVKNVSARFQNTKGILMGTDHSKLEEYPPGNRFSDNDYQDGVIDISVPGDWQKDARIIIKSKEGLPMNILSYSVKLEGR